MDYGVGFDEWEVCGEVCAVKRWKSGGVLVITQISGKMSAI